jgi:uncharacterized protein
MEAIMTPIDVVRAILADPKSLANVKKLTAPDVPYGSLNCDNPDLKRVMPWCGTGRGPEAIVQTFVDVGRYWAVESFDLGTVFGSGDACRDLRQIHLPLYGAPQASNHAIPVYARIEDGLCSYLQFMADTIATTASFRSGGAWLIKSNPEGQEISV